MFLILIKLNENINIMLKNIQLCLHVIYCKKRKNKILINIFGINYLLKN